MVAPTKEATDGFQAGLGILLDQEHTHLSGQDDLANASSGAQLVYLQSVVVGNSLLDDLGGYLFVDLGDEVVHDGLGQFQIDDFLTPAAAAYRWLSHHVENKIALFVTEATVSEFDRFDITDDPADDIDAVVIGDIGEGWDFATMNRAFRMLVNNPDAHLIALGKTRYWKGADGMQLDTGPFVVALRYATKRKPLVLGKPARKFYQAALAHLATPPEETLMIGDDIVGDIKAANKRGFHTVLVRTGKFSELDLNMGIEPNKVLDSIRDLPEYWESISHIQG